MAGLCRGIQLLASPAATRAPRAATQPPRRQAWLRIFVVQCSLPCDPPVGGHSCNGGMIPRFYRAVCDLRPVGKSLGLKAVRLRTSNVFRLAPKAAVIMHPRTLASLQRCCRVTLRRPSALDVALAVERRA